MITVAVAGVYSAFGRSHSLLAFWITILTFPPLAWTACQGERTARLGESKTAMRMAACFGKAFAVNLAVICLVLLLIPLFRPDLIH